MGVNADTDRDQCVFPEIWWLKHVETSRKQCYFPHIFVGKLVVETWGETPRNRKTAMFFQMWFPKNTFLGKVDSSRQPSMPMLDDRWTSQDFIIKHQNFPSNLDAWICSRYFEATAATSDHFAIHFAIPLLFGTCQSSNAK